MAAFVDAGEMHNLYTFMHLLEERLHITAGDRSQVFSGAFRLIVNLYERHFVLVIALVNPTKLLIGDVSRLYN